MSKQLRAELQEVPNEYISSILFEDIIVPIIVSLGGYIGFRY